MKKNKLEVGGIQVAGRQRSGALDRAGAFGFNRSQGKSLGGVNFQGHPAAYVIQTLCQSEAVEGAADQ